MADDPALIWEDRRPPRRRPVPPPAASGEAPPPAETPLPGGRIPLAEAHHQFGVPASTLAAWARAGTVDAVKQDGRWMVTPSSVAARLSTRHGGRPRPSPKAAAARRPGAPGPTADGTSMLVPRDAWDKLMDQLGNLHEAGQMLAEARERAAKAETEASFLRERLSELRGERDRLRSRLGERDPGGEPPGLWWRLRSAFRAAPPPE